MTTFADIVADAFRASHGPNAPLWNERPAEWMAAAILADPRLVELLAGAIERSEAARGVSPHIVPGGIAPVYLDAAAAIIRSLGETK